MFSKSTLARPDATPTTLSYTLLRHPLFALVGLRPILGQHTWAEDVALRKWATGKSQLVEIGVAEGASAVSLRQAMSPRGTLWLIDPFHLSRVPILNALKRVAHRAVNNIRNGRVVWIDKFSSEAAESWSDEIDFLFIDGDHSEIGVQHDWDDWHKFVIPGGVVAFHDAALFPGGWPRSDWGPVIVVEKLFRRKTLPGWRIVHEVDSLVIVQRS